MYSNIVKNQSVHKIQQIEDSPNLRAYLLLRTVQEIQNSMQAKHPQLLQAQHRKKIALNRWK